MYFLFDLLSLFFVLGLLFQKCYLIKKSKEKQKVYYDLRVNDVILYIFWHRFM